MDDDEIKKRLANLEKETEDLKKKLEDNTAKDKERDERHHQELKTLTQENHKEKMTWNKATAILIPLTVAIVPLILR